MNFDFWTDNVDDNKANDGLNSESTSNIIVDGFTMNQVSPSTMHSKLMPYKNYVKIHAKKSHTSQNSWKANSEIMGDRSNKDLFAQPYTKLETKKLPFKNISKPNSFYKKQPYSSSTSDHNNSRIGSEKRSPSKILNKLDIMGTNNTSKSLGKHQVKSKNSSKKRIQHKLKYLNRSIESNDEFDSNPVYIDTGGSNMQ